MVSGNVEVASFGEALPSPPLDTASPSKVAAEEAAAVVVVAVDSAGPAMNQSRLIASYSFIFLFFIKNKMKMERFKDRVTNKCNKI